MADQSQRRTNRRQGRGDRRGVGDLTAAQFSAFKFSWLSRVADAPDLPPIASRLAIKMADKFFAYDQGGVAYMAQATLAEMLDVRRQTVNEIMSAIVRAGLLRIIEAGGRTNAYIMGGIEDGITELEKGEITVPRDCDVSENPDKMTLATCPENRTDTSARGDRKTGQEPVRKTGQDHVGKTGHKHRVYEHRVIEHLESSSFHSEDSEGSLRSPLTREGENPENDSLIEPASPSPSGKIAEAETFQACQEAEPKADAKAPKPRTAGKIAKPPREPVQGDLIAEDAKRTVVQTLRAFRETYPAGEHNPHTEAEWQKVGVALKSSLTIATAAEILDGVARYAASGQDPAFIRAPKNWLTSRDWLKPWAPRRAPAGDRTTAILNGYDATVRRLHEKYSAEDPFDA